jgi:hypothetical protein
MMSLKKFMYVTRKNIEEDYKNITDHAYKQSVMQEEVASRILKCTDKLGLYYRHGGGKNGQ